MISCPPTQSLARARSATRGADVRVDAKVNGWAASDPRQRKAAWCATAEEALGRHGSSSSSSQRCLCDTHRESIARG